MGCFQHLRALPKPLGNRGLLQADQTDLAGLRLSRALKAGYPLAALVSILMYLLLRFQAWRSQWPHSFARVFTMIRGVVWDRFDPHDILAFHGTASNRWRMRVQLQAAYLPGEDWNAYGIA